MSGVRSRDSHDIVYGSSYVTCVCTHATWCRWTWIFRCWSGYPPYDNMRTSPYRYGLPYSGIQGIWTKTKVMAVILISISITVIVRVASIRSICSCFATLIEGSLYSHENSCDWACCACVCVQPSQNFLSCSVSKLLLLSCSVRYITPGSRRGTKKTSVRLYDVLRVNKWAKCRLPVGSTFENFCTERLV